MEKDIIMTGIKPTNNLHLGNLLGCIMLYENIHFENKNIYFFIPDLHALTTNTHLQKNYNYDIIRYLLSIVSNNNIYFYIQSEHDYVCKLSWIFNCLTPLGDLQRMTQFKDKQNEINNINAGLLNYPVLMAADILSLNANIVPVGDDQSQHLEFARRIANKFNNTYKINYFNIPTTHVFEQRRIYNLKTPSIKMSKSYGPTSGTIFLNDTREQIIYKIQRATTDNLLMPANIDEMNTRHNIANLMNIYKIITKDNIENIINTYKNQPISNFKQKLGNKLSEFIVNIHEKSQQYTNEYIEKMLLQHKNHLNDMFQKQNKDIMNIIYNMYSK